MFDKNCSRPEMQSPSRDSTPVLPFSRAVFVLGVCLTAGTGVGLSAVPDRTADYWAWTIKAPLTAAFFGAGYIAAALSLAFAARARSWQQARVVAVAALTLTTLALLATLLDTEPFAFGEGGLPEVVAWIWLGVYIALPPLVLAVFVMQERAGGAHEYASATPALAITRLVFGAAGLALGVVGVLLLADWRWLAERWPWPLPALPATVVGAWLCTYAACFLWFAVRERDWRRVRIIALPALLMLVLDLVAAGRFWDDLGGVAATALYLAALGLLIAAIAGAAIVEELRLRRPAATAGSARLAGG
jgi:hypothetical protein